MNFWPAQHDSNVPPGPRRIRGCSKVYIFQWLTRLNRDSVINCAIGFIGIYRYIYEATNDL